MVVVPRQLHAMKARMKESKTSDGFFLQDNYKCGKITAPKWGFSPMQALGFLGSKYIRCLEYEDSIPVTSWISFPY